MYTLGLFESIRYYRVVEEVWHRGRISSRFKRTEEKQTDRGGGAKTFPGQEAVGSGSSTVPFPTRRLWELCGHFGLS